MSSKLTHLVCGSALDQATAVCVFVHGRGQSPEIMRESILARVQMRRVHFILPRASTGSWYDAKAVDPLTPVTKSQLVSSLQVLRQAVEQLPRNLPLLLAGFSQGACLSLEYAMAHGPWQGGLACFTGCRVGAANDERAKSDFKAMPVYLSGSDNDGFPSKRFQKPLQNSLRAAQDCAVTSCPDVATKFLRRRPQYLIPRLAKFPLDKV
jgi:phospholipase/carboxylesterase